MSAPRRNAQALERAEAASDADGMMFALATFVLGVIGIAIPTSLLLVSRFLLGVHL